MTTPIGSYSFLPWLRQGVASSISATDGDATVKLRAAIQVQLSLSGSGVSGGTLSETVARDVQLFGPGDVIGIDAKAIIRTEPRRWTTNFEPNYLAAIEFYDEDFPWRYTPAAPDGSRLRLRPWLALVVLEDGAEFTDGKNIDGRPLPYIEVADPNRFPPAADLWAWAHVHVNRSLAASEAELVSSDMNAVLPRFQSTLTEDADLAYSRIVCPRLLAEKTAYTAFLVPVFESGRLAGLGHDPVGAPHATASAWAGTGQEATFYPVYYRWSFHTGAQGDFESLVRLLEPKPVNARVGVRDMDVRHPGSNLPPIDDAALNGVLKLGGALRVPDKSLTPEEKAEREHNEKWAQPAPHPFTSALTRFVNLPDDYEAKTAAQANAASGLGAAVTGNPDPLLTAPIYGRWHALASRLRLARDGSALPNRDNWVHELNLDPRFRVPAAFGTGVVQAGQEDYMRAAWQQIGDVIEANRRIRQAQLAREAAWTMYERQLVPLMKVNAERALSLTAPTHAHVLMDGVTLRHARGQSPIAPAMTSVVARRMTRPRSRIMRALPFDAERSRGNLLARMNAGAVSVAPVPVTPPALPTVAQVADQVAGSAGGGVLLPWLRRPWLSILLFIIAALLLIAALFLPALAIVLIVLSITAILLAVWSRRLARLQRIAQGIREDGQTPDAVDALAPSPDNPDTPETTRFKAALRDWADLRTAGAKTGVRPNTTPVPLARMTTTVVNAINPVVTIPRRAAAGVVLPARILANLEIASLIEKFDEIMAYPVIDVPMYKPLTDLSSEMFLPNLNLIPPNSITLLETNQRFIEAYMVGINHEFSRELLWREYPTDQRGTCFRQFWDVRGVLPDASLTPEQQREALRDIPPIHQWSRQSKLGAHDNRDTGAPEDEVVLVIRGELLKKYPTAVIYAQRAQWQRNPDGSIDPSKERELVELTPDEEDAPPASKLLVPLYEAKVEPDIYFFGFDLTSDEAVGGTGEQPNDSPGWFFVIRERPGEPRFGFDVARNGPVQTMNDLAWSDAVPGGAPGAYVAASSLSSITLQALGASDVEKTEQRADDVKANVAPVSAARWAYVLYQAPMMVAVHAAEMLRR